MLFRFFFNNLNGEAHDTEDVEEEDEEVAPPPPKAKKAKPAPAAEEEAEPEVRKTATKVTAVPAKKGSLSSIVADWDDE